MKIRLTDNCIRMRLSQDEVQQLLQNKTLQTRLSFKDNPLNYILHINKDIKKEECNITFSGSDISIAINEFLGNELQENTSISIQSGLISCDIEVDLHSRR